MSETRKLVAILVADVVGYGPLAGADEDRTLARLLAARLACAGSICTSSDMERRPGGKPLAGANFDDTIQVPFSWTG